MARTPLTHDDVIERCEALAPRLAERAAEAERIRRLTPDTIDDLVELDLLPMVVPTSLGGHGLGMRTLAHSTRILGHGCTASAWTISFLVMHSWLLARFPPRARSEFFTPDRPWALAPAPLAPTGTIRPVDGGFIVSGRWEWATAVHHSDWVMVHAIQLEPELTSRFAVVPIGDVVIDDVWHTSGMCATGSDTVRLDEVFVPADRALVSSELLMGSEPAAGDGLAGLPVAPMLALMASAPAIGAAERCTELYRARVAERVLAYSLGDRAVDQPGTHMRLGAVTSDLAATRDHWDASIDALDRAAGCGEMSVERRMALRLAAAATVRSSRSIIGAIADGAGASVYFESSPFQQFQRDLEVLKGHVIFDWDRTTQLAGRVTLGLPLKPTDMV